MSAYDLHPEAFADIDEIAIFIDHDSSEAAHRAVDEIYRAIQTVIPFPQRGHRRSDLTGRPFRFIRVRGYLIAYAPYENPLWPDAPFINKLVDICRSPRSV